MVFSPLGAALIQMAISHSREFEADRLGAEWVGTGRDMAKLFMTHPPMDERIRRLRAMGSY